MLILGKVRLSLSYKCPWGLYPERKELEPHTGDKNKKRSLGKSTRYNFSYYNNINGFDKCSYKT